MYVSMMCTLRLHPRFFFFFFNDTATTEIYTLSLHDALPIYFFAPQAHLAVLNSQRLIGRGAQLAVNAFARTMNSEQFNVNFVGADSRQRTAARQAGSALQLSGRVPLAGRDLRWLAGADAAYHRTPLPVFEVPPSGPRSPTQSVRTHAV